MTWAGKRKLQYFIGFVVMLALFIGVPAFLILYDAPNCFDGKQNQHEQGVDCSGPCAKLCPQFEIQPVIQWQQTLQVLPGVYTAVAYVQNPNIQAESKNVSYTFTFYNSANTPIATRKGTTYIPPGRNFAVVETGILINGKAPARALFDWDKEIVWTRTRQDLQTDLAIKNQVLQDASTSPSITANVENASFTSFPRVDVTAIVYDAKGNAFAASKTFIENFDGKMTKPVVFTWPKPFPVIEEICSVPTDVILGIDRSGSMASDGKNPPQPLTTVKQAASTFIGYLKSNDKAAVLSFATIPTVDTTLTSDKAILKNTINSISIFTSGTQYTNIADTISKAMTEFNSGRHTEGSKKALVILTDGIPTYPEKKGDTSYPQTQALQKATEAKNQGIEVFSIGLGKELNNAFLDALASSPEHHFSAASGNDVGTVYGKVAEALCRNQAVRVEIIATIPPR
jgi:hypothetical protein